MIPTSLNVYRGQADHGIGEAGTAIKRGEQFLAADEPLRSDPERLRAIRDWLTLDATPGDVGRLQAPLEGWSCFPIGPYYVVCRLRTAGKYDRRDAYLAHGRAWPLAAFAADFDPGLYLGQGAAFLDQALTAAPEPPAPPGIDLPDPTPAGRDLAVSLLAHLFHGMVAGWPVIMAVPVMDFAAGHPLVRTIACARGALPGRLRRRCRIRIFSRDPQRFLGTSSSIAHPDPADLLVIPEDLSVAALTAAKRRAVLLDARGERRDGPEPPAGLFDYARAVLECAARFPAHLTAFGERFDQLWADDGRLPTPDLTHWVTLTYNMAVALAGTQAHRGSLFATFLLNQARAAPDLPWSVLIRPHEWAGFPPDPLSRFILRADDDLSAGEQRLQGVLGQAFQHGGLTLDVGLAVWWNPADPEKRRRLLALCDLDPPLISPAQSAALIGRLIGTGVADDPAALPLPEVTALAGELLRYPRTLVMLIQHGAWLAWRHRAAPALDLDQDARHRVALHWLTSPAFADLRDPAARQRPPHWCLGRPQDQPKGQVDTTLETWHQVLDDLGPLTLEACRRLTQPRTQWPWLHPFQSDQMQDLAARCDTLDTVAELVAALVRATGSAPDDLCKLLWQTASLRSHGPAATLDALHGAVAELLEPGIGARRAQAAWIGQLIAVLAGHPADRPSPDADRPVGCSEDQALESLRRRVQALRERGERGAEAHPLIQLVRAILALPPAERARSSPLMQQGWGKLQRGIATDPACYDWAERPDGRRILPLYHLAATLRPGPWNAGGLALWLMHEPPAAGLRADPQWWQALLGSLLEGTALPILGSPRQLKPLGEPAEATRQAALGLIDAERARLPGAEAQALNSAWDALDPLARSSGGHEAADLTPIPSGHV